MATDRIWIAAQQAAESAAQNIRAYLDEHDGLPSGIPVVKNTGASPTTESLQRSLSDAVEKLKELEASLGRR